MLNGIAVSAPYLHFATVILHAWLSDLPNHMKLRTMARNEEKTNTVVHRHYHPVASFNYMCTQVYYICYYAVIKNTAG